MPGRDCAYTDAARWQGFLGTQVGHFQFEGLQRRLVTKPKAVLQGAEGPNRAGPLRNHLWRTSANVDEVHMERNVCSNLLQLKNCGMLPQSRNVPFAQN